MAKTKNKGELVWPGGDPRLLSLAPMIYVAWADGDLTRPEMDRIRERIEKFDWLDEESAEQVGAWLQPDSPPSPRRLSELLSRIRQGAEALPEDRRLDLVELGLELARLEGEGDGAWATEEICGALEEVQAALGVAAEEACRELLIQPGEPEVDEVEAPMRVEPAFDVSRLARLLDGEYAEVRDEVRALLSAPEFAYRYGIDSARYRELVYSWCKTLAETGLGASSFPEEYGGQDDFGRGIAVFETLALGDLSLLVKFGVQFGLFGGSVYLLGTKKHHDAYLKRIGTLELPGCFAMTEAAHGSNVRDIETVARYDPDTEEFVIHTPRDSARKIWIGNAALHGRMATVFAQLETRGTRYGVHAFLVPIRDESGSPSPGVRIEDMGEKMGLNGVDNGVLWFDHVRVPRDNLLDRYAQVAADGTYSSPITSDSKRFFTMLSALVVGRISVAAAAVSAAKSALTIAVRYGERRRQFGPAGQPEFLLMDYRMHQRRLLPLVAATYGADFAIKHLTGSFLEKDDDYAREVEVLAAGLKAYMSWHAVRTVQTARECCGGMGYLAENRFAALKADTDVFTTFEGDNIVLLQLVAKGLLSQYKQQFQDTQFFGLVKYVGEQAARRITEQNPVVTRLTDEDHLRDPEFQLGAFAYREEHLLVTAARRLKKRIDEGRDSFVAFNECQDHLITLAVAHVERVILEQYDLQVSEAYDDDIRRVLTSLRDLFALWRIEEDRGWFQESGYIEGGKAKAIRKLVNKLCSELREQALPLVNAFGIPDAMLEAPIGVMEYTG